MAFSFCDKTDSYELDEGIDFKKFAGRRYGAPKMCTGIAIFQSSASLRLHIHSYEESVTMLEGEALCGVGRQLVPLHPFDTCFVLPNIPHRFTNASLTKRLVILWAYSMADVDRIVIERNSADPDRRCKGAKYLPFGSENSTDV